MTSIKAALFDFGGVILSSPFEAFNDYESRTDLPRDFIRTLNSTNPDTNAWARYERSEVDFDSFCSLFEAEASAAGYSLVAREVMPLLAGKIRPEMVEALRRCGERLKTACLTNNVIGFNDFPERARANGRDEVLGLFDCIIESSKVGVRKPDPRFYEIACEQLSISPSEAVFLDDLGVNLKPARELGMQTIKVTDPHLAIAELEAIVGFPLHP
ncbi:MAG: putative hydrolase of the superfamily [Actinomycetota bacterium]|nr:putative hydrolase of the superfamily [Actinomycetota bacterium]